MDTGALTLVSNMPGVLPTPQSLFFPASIIIGNGARLPIMHTAATTLPTALSPLHLNNVLISPSIVKNWIAVRQLTRDNNVYTKFDPSGFYLKDLPTRTTMLQCESSGALYPLHLPPQLTLNATFSVDPWHQRLGHPGSDVLQKVLQNFDFHYNKSELHSCHSCRLRKHVWLPFSNSVSRTYFPFQIIHADVWTSPTISCSGYKFYPLLLDDYTHYAWTFPIQQKSEVLPLLRAFHAYVRAQFHLPILMFQTNNGHEFDSIAIRLFFSEHGVALRLSCPYTSHQNGKAERTLRTLNDCLPTLLIHSAAPMTFWVEALSTATYLT
jgi:hypothetical protein